MPESEKKIFTHLDSVKDMKFEELTKDIFVGTQTSLDDVYLVLKQQDIDTLNVLVRPKGKKQGKQEYLLEKQILKPILKGKDISKWFLNWSNHWLVFPYKKENKIIPYDQMTLELEYTNTWKYFLAFEDSLKNRENNKMRERDDWYAFVYPKNHEKFEQTKLISQLFSQNNRFALDVNGIYYFIAVGGDCISLKEKYKDINSYKYILALLNSSPLNFYMKHISPVHDGGYYLYIKQYLARLPIITYKAQNPIINSIITFVDRILTYNNLNSPEIYQFEKNIDTLIYKLFQLNNNDVKVIETFNERY